VERSEISGWPADDEAAIASSRYPTSARLLAAIHQGDSLAIKELFLLYAPLLRDQARKMSIGPDERDALVTTLLDDAVLHLMENQIAPRHLTRYLVASLRNRARNHQRSSQRRCSTRDGAYSEFGSARERIVAECHSEYGLRASLPTDALDPLPLRSAIAKLAQTLAHELTKDEMIMIVGVGRHLPLRDMAEQLGITYGTARVRLHRLRERFRKLATQYVVSLKPHERREVERFFRRAQLRLTCGSEEKPEQSVIESAQQNQRGKSNGQV
jgi:RNA polymerase sigma factor (sigma-70 family)